jgi:restriction endonuclease Mrr
VSWARLDDQFSDHPKVRALGVFGLALQAAAICYSARYLTDGFLSFSAVDQLIASVFAEFTLPDGRMITPAVTCGMSGQNVVEWDWKSLMIRAGLWEKTRKGVRVHDYLLYNPSRESVLKERAKVAERVARHRQNGNAVTHAIRNDAVTPTPSPYPKNRKDVDSKPDDRFDDLSLEQRKTAAREQLRQVVAKMPKVPKT